MFKVGGCWTAARRTCAQVPAQLLHCLGPCHARPSHLLFPACATLAAGILAHTFVGAGEGQAQAAAAQTLQDLLGVVAEPKQQAQVRITSRLCVSGEASCLHSVHAVPHIMLNEAALVCGNAR